VHLLTISVFLGLALNIACERVENKLSFLLRPISFLNRPILMKLIIVRNKYLNALFVLMLFSAAIHMLILAYLAFKAGDPYILNYFNILDVDIFIPGFLNSEAGNLLSLAFTAGFYFLILAKNK